MNKRKLSWWQAAIYFVLTTVFFIVGWEVAGFAITTIMFLAIVILAQMGKSN